jgi:hypothetical protein
MQIRKSDALKIFEKLELVTRSTTHRYGWFTVGGRKILRVHVSHGKGDIPGKVSDKIRSQLKLNRNDFRRLIDCTLSREGYVAILRDKGLID